MNNSLYYITYQDFPANTANSQQTIASCKYFKEITLKLHYFPFKVEKVMMIVNLS